MKQSSFFSIMYCARDIREVILPLLCIEGTERWKYFLDEQYVQNDRTARMK